MTIIDTSALVRYFVEDDPLKAKRVGQLLKSEVSVFISDVVFSELYFVLLKSYDVSREQMSKALLFLVQRANVQTSLEAKLAVNLLSISTLSFVDCLLIILSKGNIIASFDKHLIKLSGAKSYWK